MRSPTRVGAPRFPWGGSGVHRLGRKGSLANSTPSAPSSQSPRANPACRDNPEQIQHARPSVALIRCGQVFAGCTGEARGYAERQRGARNRWRRIDGVECPYVYAAPCSRALHEEAHHVTSPGSQARAKAAQKLCSHVHATQRLPRLGLVEAPGREQLRLLLRAQAQQLLARALACGHI